MMALNVPALTAAAAVTMLAALMFGALPAFTGARQKPVDALKDGSEGSGAARTA